MIGSGSMCRMHLTALAASILVLACGGQASHETAGPQPSGDPQPTGSPPPSGSPQPPASPQPGPASAIVVSFKLDPRLQGGTYGGDVWVSPPTYVGATAQDTVEARALAVDANGQPTNDSPDWIASDPDMITVTPGAGTEVTLIVKRAGESLLRVTSPGLAKQLLVRATSAGGAIVQVEISQ